MFSSKSLHRAFPRRRPTAQSFRPRLECLEDRRVPAVFAPVPDALDEPVDTDGKMSLREAIIAANANGPGVDTINLTHGAYKLKLAGEGEDDAQTGDLDIKSDLIIVGVARRRGRNPIFTTIDGNGLDRIFHIHNFEDRVEDRERTGFNVRIRHVTMKNGKVVSSEQGGAIFVDHGALTIKNSRLVDNKALGVIGSGGAIYNLEGDVTLKDTVLKNNRARGGQSPGLPEQGLPAFGGAIYNNHGDLSLVRARFENNVAWGFAIEQLGSPPTSGGDGLGGAIYNLQGNITSSRTVFHRNRALGGNGFASNGGDAEGGAIFNHSGALDLGRTEFSLNDAVGGVGGDNDAGVGRGGAIYVRFTHSLNIKNSSVFYGNVARGGAVNNGAGGNAYGGALFIHGAGTASSLLITKTKFVSNSARGGAGGPFGSFFEFGPYGDAHSGAIFVHGVDTPLTITKSLITRNLASGLGPIITLTDVDDDGLGKGGGLYITSSGQVNLTGSLVFSNHASTPGGGGGALIEADGVLVDGLFFANTFEDKVHE